MSLRGLVNKPDFYRGVPQGSQAHGIKTIKNYRDSKLISAVNGVQNTQPCSQSSSVIFDVTSPVKLVGKIRAIGLGSKPPLVTRIAPTGLGTRLQNTPQFP